MNIHWHSVADFLAMGKHGFYVWGSVAMMLLLMIGEPLVLRSKRRTLLARLQRQYRAERAEAACAGNAGSADVGSRR